MSRIGRKPILMPQGVDIKINNREILIKGPKGEIKQEFPEEVSVALKDNNILVSLIRKTKKSPALWGLTRSLLENNIEGVVQGFEKKLEIQGIGFKASVQKEKTLVLDVGFTHSKEIEIPEGLKVAVEKNIIVISGIDKQKVGEFAAVVRRVKPPEPYKGKGIRYLGERVRIKEGKKAAGATA